MELPSGKLFLSMKIANFDSAIKHSLMMVEMNFTKKIMGSNLLPIFPSINDRYPYA